MEMTDNDIKQLIQSSFTAVQAEPDKGDSVQKINQNRSRSWVTVLAKQFQNHYQDNPEIRVFSKYDYSNRKDFGLNELLYDIVVCRVGEVLSTTHKKTLYFIKESIWQVESEFAHDSKQALVDFNKLVLGSAQNKLFIGPEVRDIERFIDLLKPAARACSGNVYVALIPHPAKWKVKYDYVQLWSLKR